MGWPARILVAVTCVAASAVAIDRLYAMRDMRHGVSRTTLLPWERQGADDRLIPSKRVLRPSVGAALGSRGF